MHEVAHERLKGLCVFAYVGKEIVATNRIKLRISVRISIKGDNEVRS